MSSEELSVPSRRLVSYKQSSHTELSHHLPLPSTREVRRYLLENEEAHRHLKLDRQPFQVRFLGRGAANIAYRLRTQEQSDRVVRVARAGATGYKPTLLSLNTFASSC